jgi:quercetin dioxygenase-like cupin family protein
MDISPASTTGIAAPPEWITGQAWIDTVTTGEKPSATHVDRVRFAPGARTVWHRHRLGQVLVVTDGTGLVQRRGGNVEAIHAGDPLTRTILLDQPLLAPVTTHRVEIRRITIAPGHAAGTHVHNGPVFGSIETGSVIYQVDGDPGSVLGPGDVFYEPEGVRIARFDAQDEGVTFLGYFLLDADDTPQIEFPDA